MEWLLVLGWLVFFVLIGALALPATAALLDPLGGRGAGFAITGGVTVITFVTFWLGHVRLTGWTPLVGVVLVGCCSALALRRGTEIPTREYGEAVVVFAGAFALAVGIRAVAPQLTVWAEAYLDYGLVRSILRATTLPPEDVWYAGEPVQYYYGGHLTIATWADLTGTPARYLPNLATASFYALMITGAYELAGTVGLRHGAPRRLAGGLGVFLFGLAGNLATPVKLLVLPLPDATRDAVFTAFELDPSRFTGGLWFFDAPHFVGLNTEFPLYSVLIQSYHGHVTSQPFSLLVAGLLFAYFLTEERARSRRLLRLLAVVPVLGVVAITNLWSLPLGVGLTALGVAFADAHPASLWPGREGPRLTTPARRELGRYVGGVGVALAVGVAAALAVAPFLLLTDASRPIGVLPDRSGLGLVFFGYGSFLLAFGLFLAPRLRRNGPDLRWIVAVVAVAGLLGYAADFVAFAVLVPFLLGGWWLLRRSNEAGFETVLLLGGAGLALLIELVYVRGGAEPGRYNTVYKVYSQVWLLLAVGAGGALAVVIDDVRQDAWTRPGFPRARDIATVGLACVLCLSVALYGGVFLTSHFARGGTADPTLDATRFIETEHPGHDRAITWLGRTGGQPHVVEAVPSEGTMYRFNASPASSLTGLPTVAGWTHAADYHSESGYRSRRQDVRRIYEGSDATRAALLRKYDVEYVYLSPTERARYDVAELGTQPGIELVFEAGTVDVYAVDRTAL